MSDQNYSSDKRVYFVTALASCILAGVILGILLWDFKGDERSTFSLWKIAIIGIITFFGMLMISSYHSHNHPSHIKGSKGVMRRAITSSFLVVYFVLFSLVLSETEEVNENSSAQHILENFTNIIIVIIGFYFGSKGAIEIFKQIRGDKSEDSENVSDDESTDKVCVIKESFPDDEEKNIVSYSHDGPLHRESDIKWNKEMVTYALVKGAEASLLTTQGEIESDTDESATIPTELIVAQTTYLEAFEEVIQKQIF